MNFFEILPQTSYTEDTKNYVASFIMDYFSDSKLNNIYLVSKSFGFSSAVKENIFLIQKTIQVIEEQKQVKIARILIYIPTNFPNAAPKFYLERAENHSIVEVQKDIDKSTYEIKTKSISEWRNIGDFNRILSDIIASFNRFYPLYKLEIHKRKGIIYPENSFVPQNALKISLDSGEQNDFNNNNYNMPNAPVAPNQNIPSINNPNVIRDLIDYRDFNRPQGANPNLINGQISSSIKQHEEKISFTDDEIKKILLEHTILAMRDKFLQNYYENKKIKVAIDEMKTDLNKKINEIGDRIEQGKKIKNAFEMLQKELNKEIANLKDEIIKSSRRHLSFENFRDFVHVPDKQEQLMKLISVESTLEDFIYSLKKSFEKNILSFDETMKYTRKISKEIFVINFLKKKLIDEGE